ncbi:MAG: PQQ-binding-like beta-propeller repeat protein [Thermoguttaceae bacterium]
MSEPTTKYGKWTAAVIFSMAFLCIGRSAAPAADWPQWRCDAGRTAASSEELPAELHMQWVRNLSAPQPAWPRYPRLCFDASYEPVASGKTLFVPSMVTDSVTALDTDTGAVRWRFFADGPVRMAPIASQGKVWFVSDDGYLYCVGAARGELLWKFRGLPSDRNDRKVLGNDRLISLWPARGGPVLADGRIYFAAGIWPFDGIYIYAIDAQTGKPIWMNEDCGNIADGLIDHSMRQDSGLAPQGYFAVAGDKLIVPSGRALAGVLDRKTGKLMPYLTGWGGRDNLAKGCWYVTAIGKYLFQSGEPYDMTTQTDAPPTRLGIEPANAKELGEFRELILTDHTAYYSRPINQQQGYRPAGVGYDRIVAVDVSQPLEVKTFEDGSGRKWKSGSFSELWNMPSDLKIHIKAGSRLYGGAEGMVAAIDVPAQGSAPKVSWQATIEGTPSRMLAADGKLFVVTTEGTLYGFGPKQGEPTVHAAPKKEPVSSDDPFVATARDVLDATGVSDGYCLVLGVGTGQLAVALAEQSALHVIAIDPDAAKVERLRNTLTESGLYGTRIVVHQGDIASYPLPPYLASLIVSEDQAAATRGVAEADLPDIRRELSKKAFRWLRPHTGVCCLRVPNDSHEAYASLIRSLELPGAEVGRSGNFALLRRTDAPTGAANWTHEDADAAGSLVSQDVRIKAPLDLLWFGGAVDMLFPEWDFTHTRPTTPLVVGGRMFFQVFPDLHAVDIYSGRHLWTTQLPGTKTNPQRRNVNYVATEDSVYVATGGTCHRLDPATGSTVGRIRCPGEESATWREVRISGDCLIGTTGQSIVCMDRLSGQLKWTHRLTGGDVRFAVGGRRVFGAVVTVPDRRGQVTEPSGQLVALDLREGGEQWRTSLKFETKPKGRLRLSFSEEDDVLVVAYGTVGAYDGSKGTELWSGRVVDGGEQPMLRHGQLISQNGEILDLRTGTALPDKLGIGGRRGCTRVIGGQHLLSVRNGQASYFDLSTGRQTFFRGIRTGCTNNLIQAGGLLNAPNFAHGCACNYPIFSSMALVHLEEIDE